MYRVLFLVLVWLDDVFLPRGGMQSSECFSPLGSGVNDYVLLKVLFENSDTTEPDKHP